MTMGSTNSDQPKHSSSPRKKNFEFTEAEPPIIKKLKQENIIQVGKTLAQDRLNKIHGSLKAAKKLKAAGNNEIKRLSTKKVNRNLSQDYKTCQEEPVAHPMKLQEKKPSPGTSNSPRQFKTPAQSRLDEVKRGRKKDGTIKGPPKIVKKSVPTQSSPKRKLVESPLSNYKAARVKPADKVDECDKIKRIRVKNPEKNNNFSPKSERSLVTEKVNKTVKKECSKSPVQNCKNKINLKRNLYKRNQVKENNEPHNLKLQPKLLYDKNKKTENETDKINVESKCRNLNINLSTKIAAPNELNEYKMGNYSNSELKDNLLAKCGLSACESSLSACENSFVEDMEWEESCDDVTLHLQTVRNTVDENCPSEMMEWQESPLVLNKTPDGNIIYFVVDTNIFISSLHLVKQLQSSSSFVSENIIVVPWQVLKELDRLKSSSASHISSSVRKAIQYLLNCISDHSPNVLLQTQQQASQEISNFFVEIPDDHLIKCCFQLQSVGHNVVLLSNDKNLRLKACVHTITTISDDKMLEKMAFTNNKPGTLHLEKEPIGTAELEIYTHRLTMLFKTFLSNVIQLYLVNEHGTMWIWHMPEKLPFSLKTSLELLPNISKKILKNNQSTTYIDEVATFFTRRTYRNLSVKEVDSIARKCLTFAKLLNLKDITSEVIQFEDGLAFLKSREPTTHIPFSEHCCKLTIQHFQIFESTIIGFCYKVAQMLEINFSDSLLKGRPAVLPDGFDIRLIHEYTKISKIVHANLHRIGKIHTDQIFTHTRGIVPIYNTLMTYVEHPDPFFTVEDVVEFCKNDSVRNGLPEALEVFNNVIIFLEKAKNVAIAKKML